jgi:imidazolonepropionase-like amidohydrolase
VSYQRIAGNGRGIAATMRGLRAVSGDELIAQNLLRLDGLTAEGMEMVEIKLICGLMVQHDPKTLRASRCLPQLGAARRNQLDA